jgi:hypothetical protein
MVGPSHMSILLQNSPLSQGVQERARVFNLPVFSRAELTKMVCKWSLVERLDLLPMAVLLMSGGKLPAQRAKSAHFVGHLPFSSVFASFYVGSSPLEVSVPASSRKERIV